ncbi:MAG: hypothetical protein AABX98_06765, partial [Nanoarchaeota archaeon]
TPYKVIRSGDGYTLLGNKREKPIVTDEGFKYHIGELDRRGITPEDKVYTKLTKLAYLDYLLTKI